MSNLILTLVGISAVGLLIAVFGVAVIRLLTALVIRLITLIGSVVFAALLSTLALVIVTKVAKVKAGGHHSDNENNRNK